MVLGSDIADVSMLEVFFEDAGFKNMFFQEVQSVYSSNKIPPKQKFPRFYGEMERR